MLKHLLQELVDRCNETTNLAIMDQHEIIYIDQIESLNMIEIFARVGSRGPAHCTGAGKALLAQLTDREHDRFLQHKMPLASYTVFTIREPAVLKEELYRIRQRGYSLDNGELEAGVRCVAVLAAADKISERLGHRKR